jgi:hypothetical protein
VPQLREDEYLPVYDAASAEGQKKADDGRKNQ